MKNSSWCAVLAAVIGIGCVGLLADAFASAELLRIQGSAGFADEVMRPYQGKVEALTAFHLALPESDAFLKADLSKNTADELAYAEQAH